MKKIAFIFYTCILINSLQAQSDNNAMATKYARVLYVSKAADKNGDIKTMAAHVVLKGTGKLRWKEQINEEGNYMVLLNYSVRRNGISVTVGSEKNSVTNVLDITEGVFPEGKEWYQFNCTRKLLTGTLSLSKGTNLISLEVNPSNKDFETIIYSLELVPLNKEKAVRQETAKARRSRPNMDWFRTMKYGTMYHWTSLSTPITGPLMKYDDAVKNFDVGAFADMVEKTGSDYIIFTGCWAETYIPAPLKKWEKEYPGHTASRDLIAEISDSLKKRHIKFFLYLSTTYNGSLAPADNEFAPLIRIKGAEPGPAVFCWILTPATWPCKAAIKLLEGTRVISFALTEATDPVKSDFLTLPYPITTTSDNVELLEFNCTSKLVLSPILTSTVSIPT